MCLRPPNPRNFTNLWIVLNMCKWDLGKVCAARFDARFVASMFINAALSSVSFRVSTPAAA